MPSLTKVTKTNQQQSERGSSDRVLFPLVSFAKKFNEKGFLPYHAAEFTNLNDRQKCIYNILRYFEVKGSKAFRMCNDTLLKWLDDKGYSVSLATLKRDLSDLEIRNFIFRATWNKPIIAGGGRIRYVSTAHGIDRFNAKFMFKGPRNYPCKRLDKPKPAKTLKAWEVFRNIVDKLNEEYIVAKRAMVALYKKARAALDEPSMPQDLLSAKEQGKECINQRARVANARFTPLQTPEELRELLDEGKLDGSRVSFDKKAFVGLEPRYHRRVLFEIGRQRRFGTHGGQKLVWLYSKLRTLVQKGKIAAAAEPISYTIKCYNDREMGKFFDWKHANKPLGVANDYDDIQTFLQDCHIPNDGIEAELPQGKTGLGDPSLLDEIKRLADEASNTAIIAGIKTHFYGWWQEKVEKIVSKGKQVMEAIFSELDEAPAKVQFSIGGTIFLNPKFL